MPRGLKAGFDTYWTSFGQGPRAALMIHCSLASSASWGGVAQYLSGALTMTAFDLPGHGRSADWDGRGEIQRECVRIAADFLDGPADIIGHSFGATVALRLAVERPELVRSLVLIEPVFFAVALQDRSDMAVVFRDETAVFDAAMAEGDYVKAAQSFTEIWGGGTAWAAVPAAQQARLVSQMPLIGAANGALYEDVGGMLAMGALEQITAPVLLIEGRQSPGIISGIHDGLARRLPRSERRIIDGAAHMVPITHPAEVSDEVLRFLRSEGKGEGA